MTLNIRQGTKEKVPLVLDHLHAHEIDVTFITETGEGANLSRELKAQGEDGYVAHRAPLDNAGVTILLNKRWNHTIIKKSTIQKGRILAVTLLNPEGSQIILVGVYQKTGLDKMKNTDQDLHQAQASIDQIIDLIDHRKTSLVICGGDFNETDSEAERIRASKKKPTPRTRDATFTHLLAVGFTDTHDQGEMTCETQTKQGPSFSRIDKIFVWSHSHAKITETAVAQICYPHTHDEEEKGDTSISDHRTVYTTLQVVHTPGTTRKGPQQQKQIQTRHTTKETKTQFSLKMHETLQRNGPELIKQIQNWKQDLTGSNKAIQDFRDIVKRIAEKTWHDRKQTRTPV
jgi:hypothetical protein